MIRRKQIRLLAERLLSERGIHSAPVSVENIARSLGAVVQRQPAKDDLSGFMYRDRKGNQCLIGVNGSHHPNRQNFTAAHELGHFLLHDFDDVHVDRDFKVWLRNTNSSQGIDIEEMEANLFAAELLMPAKFLSKEMEKIKSLDPQDEGVIGSLAEKYKVSVQAMTFRLAYLNYLHH